MNNIEKITYIQNKIDVYNKEYVIDAVETDLLNEIADLLKELKKPQSLAEFLGWEEDTEYKTDYICGDYKYKVINNQLYFTKHGSDWKTYSVLDFWGIKQAKKVKPKKYQFKLKQKYIYFFNNSGLRNVLAFNGETTMISYTFCENDKLQTEFTEEEINNIVLPEPLNLDMFDKVEVK